MRERSLASTSGLSAAEYAGKRVAFKQAVVAGDRVVLHGHQVRPRDEDDGGIGISGVDEHGEVLEHWEVLQVVPATSATPTGCSDALRAHALVRSGRAAPACPASTGLLAVAAVSAVWRAHCAWPHRGECEQHDGTGPTSNAATASATRCSVARW